MTQYDDDPYNDPGRARRYAIVAIIVFCVGVLALLAWIAQAKAQDNGYLPPQKYYTQNPRAGQRPVEEDPAGPLQYYANDWIVYAPDGRVMCKDPYVELDLKVVRCIASEKWR